MTISKKKRVLMVIWEFCESCASDGEPEECVDFACPLHPHRTGAHRSRVQEKALRSLIHKRCLECCGDQFREVLNCNITKCPLYSWKSGEYKENSFGDFDEIDDIMCS